MLQTMGNFNGINLPTQPEFNANCILERFLRRENGPLRKYLVTPQNSGYWQLLNQSVSISINFLKLDGALFDCHHSFGHTVKLNPSSVKANVSDSLCFLSSQLRGPVAPYTPVFLDGWKPEALRADGQVWEDPVESEHKYEDLRVKQEVWNTCM